MVAIGLCRVQASLGTKSNRSWSVQRNVENRLTFQTELRGPQDLLKLNHAAHPESNDRNRALEARTQSRLYSRNEPVLTGGETTVLDGATVLSDDVIGGGEVAEMVQGQVKSDSDLGIHSRVEEGQETGNARRVPPVPLEVRGDRTLGHNIDTGIPHPSISKVGSAGVKGTGSVGVGEDSVTGLKERQGGEHRADLWSFPR